MKVIKKDGTIEDYNEQKIIDACNKAARRAMISLTDSDYSTILNDVWQTIEENYDDDEIEVYDMHNIVESVLEEDYPLIAKMYKEYRNYKKDFIHMMDNVYEKSQSIRYIGDKSNANTDSALVATKRSLIYNELSAELYKKFFLTLEEKQAAKDGYIYIHDRSARLDTINCFDRDTRFITSIGVKSFRDFKDGDVIKVLTHKGNWKNAVVHSYGWKTIQEVVFKRQSGKAKSVFCTPNHRWILSNGDETTSLKIGDKIIAAPNIFNISWDTMSIEEKNLWCLGFGVADGSVVQDNGIRCMHIRLCGDKKDYAKRFIDSGYTVTFPQSYNGDGFVRMNDIHSKEIPLLRLNENNVVYFINGFLSADGNRKTNNKEEFRSLQVTGNNNKYIYDLLNMAGCYVTNVVDLTGQKTNYGIRTSDTKHYGFTCNQTYLWKVVDIKPAKLNPKAQVWCLEVEDDHSFILENGITTGNCCLSMVGTIMKDGFEMGNVWYNEPTTLDVAFDVIGDIVLATASQQYGGYTIPEIDKILSYYAQKSYNKYYAEYIEIREGDYSEDKADLYAMKKIKRDFEQGWQGLEYKLNTVGSSRGDYPFVTVTVGLATDKFGKMAAITLMQVHSGGQGKTGFKRPVLFPKIVFLYDKNLHGDGSSCYPNADVFNAGLECSAKTMYPDWLSLTGEGYVPEIYKKYGRVISPMGKRKLSSCKTF